MEPISAELITERGWYWWLPAFVVDISQSQPADWSIRYWDERDPDRFTSGMCIGPIPHPLFP
jgi:hypothetical protein